MQASTLNIEIGGGSIRLKDGERILATWNYPGPANSFEALETVRLQNPGDKLAVSMAEQFFKEEKFFGFK